MGIGGRLRQRIEDFIVEELPPKERLHKEFEKKKYGEKKEEHTVFWMEKFNWDTNRAIKEIARRAHVSVKRIGIAGTKDRRAVTRQRVSIWNVPKEKLEEVNIRGITLYDFSKAEKKIQLGDSEGNRFIIIIRDIELSEEEIRRNLEKVFSEMEKGIPNVFGSQRFGVVRRLTHLVGLAMLKKDFEGACKLYLARAFEKEPERVFEIRKRLWKNWGKRNAYRDALKDFPERLKYERGMLDYLVKHHEDFAGALRRLPSRLRKMFINAVQSDIWNKAVEGENLKPGQKVVLPGYDTKLDEKNPVEKKIKKIMSGMKITTGHFKVPGMPELATTGGERDALLFPKELKIIEVGKDEFNPGKTKVEISFELPSGAYATVVLKKIMG